MIHDQPCSGVQVIQTLHTIYFRVIIVIISRNPIIDGELSAKVSESTEMQEQTVVYLYS